MSALADAIPASRPLRKIFYKVATTGLSITVALAIGSIELAQVLIRLTGASGGALDAIAVLVFGVLGYLIAGLFLLVWGSSVAIWRFGRLEQRYAVASAMHTHPLDPIVNGVAPEPLA